MQQEHMILNTDGRAYSLKDKMLDSFDGAMAKSSCVVSGSHCMDSPNWIVNRAVVEDHGFRYFRGFQFPTGIHVPSQEYGQHNGVLIVLKNERSPTCGFCTIPHDFPPILIRCYHRYIIDDSMTIEGQPVTASVVFEFTAN